MWSTKNTVPGFSNFCGETQIDFSEVNESEVKEFIHLLSEKGLSEIDKLEEKKSLDQMAVNVAYAFSKGWLQPEQVMTLLELRAMKMELSKVSVMPILDKNLELTEEAKKMLIGLTIVVFVVYMIENYRLIKSISFQMRYLN